MKGNKMSMKLKQVIAVITAIVVVIAIPQFFMALIAGVLVYLLAYYILSGKW